MNNTSQVEPEVLDDDMHDRVCEEPSEEVCEECGGSGVVKVGEFDDVHEEECICKKVERQDREMNEKE